MISGAFTIRSMRKCGRGWPTEAMQMRVGRTGRGRAPRPWKPRVPFGSQRWRLRSAEPQLRGECRATLGASLRRVHARPPTGKPFCRYRVVQPRPISRFAERYRPKRAPFSVTENGPDFSKKSGRSPQRNVASATDASVAVKPDIRQNFPASRTFRTGCFLEHNRHVCHIRHAERSIRRWTCT